MSTLRNVAALTALLGSLPAVAQSEPGVPPLRGLFYSIGNEHVGTSEELVIFAASGSRHQAGALATMTVMVFRVHPKIVATVEIGRFDSLNEYDCRSGAERTRQIAIRDSGNKLVQLLPPETTGFHAPSAPDGVTPKAARIACGDTPPAGTPTLLTITDVERMIQRYRAATGN